MLLRLIFCMFSFIIFVHASEVPSIFRKGQIQEMGQKQKWKQVSNLSKFLNKNSDAKVLLTSRALKYAT